MIPIERLLGASQGGHGERGCGSGGRRARTGGGARTRLVVPVGGDGLGLRVELRALLAVEVYVAPDGAARAREREERKWNRDGHVNSHLSHIDLPVGNAIQYNTMHHVIIADA